MTGQRPGSAYVDGRMVPIEEATIPITDWGFTRSDSTYDVVHVWSGSFFRLDDHLDRFQASMAGLRMTVAESRADIRQILIDCVVRSGLRDAYVAMICVRGRPEPGQPLHPAHAKNRFLAFVLPWVSVIPEDIQERGAHAIISSVPRIPAASIDPTIKNYHWGDLTRALFEAEDRGADTAVLLDENGLVTEGPGFNVFAVIDGVVTTPAHGALQGITRRSVLELCAELDIPAEVGDITADALREAEEIFFSTTAGGVMPVSRIDGRILANDRPGPISRRLKEAYWQRHDQGWHATPIDYGDEESSTP